MSETPSRLRFCRGAAISSNLPISSNLWGFWRFEEMGETARATNQKTAGIEAMRCGFGNQSCQTLPVSRHTTPWVRRVAAASRHIDKSRDQVVHDNRTHLDKDFTIQAGTSSARTGLEDSNEAAFCQTGMGADVEQDAILLYKVGYSGCK